MSRLNVLYILSAGRSGSTMLDITLSNAFGCASGAELCDIYDLAWRENLHCSCGGPVKNCEIWSELMPEIGETLTPIIGGWEKYESVRLNLERLRRLPNMVVGLVAGRTSTRRYQEATAVILGAVCERFGTQCVIDSSKGFSRAVLLFSNKALNCRAIWLVRSPLSVVSSNRKNFVLDKPGGIQNPMADVSPIKTALYWNLANFLGFTLKLLFRRRVYLLSYEEFCTAPESEIKLQNRWMGRPEQDAPNHLRFPLRAQHLLTGNRMRMRTLDKISLDRSRQESLTTSEFMIVHLLTAPVNALRAIISVLGGKV